MELYDTLFFTPERMEPALRRLGLIDMNDSVISTNESPYRFSRNWNYFSRRVDVSTAKGRNLTYWLKSYVGDPDDATLAVLGIDSNISRNGGIRGVVERRVRTAQYLRERSYHIPGTYVFDGGTMMQEHVEGTPLIDEGDIAYAARAFAVPGIEIRDAKPNDFILSGGTLYCVDPGIFVVKDPEKVGISI